MDPKKPDGFINNSEWKRNANQREQETEIEGIQQEFATPDSQEKRKEVPGSSRPMSQTAKASKTLNSCSSVWDHYTRTTDNRDKCVCHYCKKIFTCPTKSGTSNLQKHLKTCKNFKAWEEGKVRAQPAISKDGYPKDAKNSEAVLKEATNMMLFLGEMLLSFVESLAWKCFCNKVNLAKPQSRKTKTRQIVKMYVKRKFSLKERFSVNKQRVSLTTDIWVAQATCASYIVITTYFIDASWNLKKLILGFKYIRDHKAAAPVLQRSLFPAPRTRSVMLNIMQKCRAVGSSRCASPLQSSGLSSKCRAVSFARSDQPLQRVTSGRNAKRSPSLGPSARSGSDSRF
ncbi:hypothetical protein N665_0532s0038 [Sinapis alba]|nr:hypothetical protein N665_0532s0038 [Sinapis alba]